MSLLTIVVLLVFACNISTAALCPRIDTQIDFNITLYAGIWYEIYRHDVNEVGYKCINETFVANPNGTMSVLMQDVTPSNTSHSHQGIAILKKSLEPAAFLIHLTNPTQTIKYNVIKTDYTRYSLIFSCDYVPLMDINFQHIWMLSRNKTLSADIVTDLKKILREMHAREDIDQTTQDC